MELDRQPYPFGARIVGAIASTALLAGCSVISDKHSDSENASHVDPALIVPTDIITIGGDLYCYNRYHRNDYAPKTPGTVVTDGRCNIDPTEPLEIFGGANYQKGLLATAKTGAVLVALCFEKGDPVRNLAGEPSFSDEMSSVWIRVKLEPTYASESSVKRNKPFTRGETPTIPATWVQGADTVTKQC